MYVDGGALKKSFFKEGDIVFKEGDPGDTAYIVESGAVGIFKTLGGEEIRLAVIKPGELFGEMAIIDGSKRMARAMALQDCVVVNIPRAGFDSMLAKQPPFVKTLIQILADNLRNVHETYQKRPRSLRDYLNGVTINVKGFRGFLKRYPDVDLSGDAMRRIDEVDAHVTALRGMVAMIKDPRESVTELDGKEDVGAGG
ncbi:MAG TPA: cyclic nucleotide-binding domain-containing protein [Rhodospirillales bacterium]|jgi:CRP-like cAMP-binding protein